MQLRPLHRELREIPIVLTAFDGDDPTVHVIVEYDRGAGYQPAFEADVSATSAGVEQTLTWRASDALGPSYVPVMRLRITPVGGAAVESEPFEFGNDAPTITSVKLGASISDNTIVELSVSDSAGDAFDLTSFEIDTGAGYQPFPIDASIIPSGAISALLPGTHTFTWASRLTSIIDAPAARLRLTVRDAYDISAPVESSAFHLRNQTAPVISNLRSPAAPYGRATGPLGFLYELSDDNADPATVTFEYSLDGGVSYLPCVEYARPESDGSQGLLPGTHAFIWDAAGVSWRAQDLVAVIRATPAQPGLTGAPVLLTLSNGVGSPMLAPYARPTLVHTVGFGDSTGKHGFADFNGDGRVDVAFNDGLDEYVSLQQAGCPTSSCFAGGPPLTAAAGTIRAFAPADVNEDGFADLITIRDNDVTLRMGDASGIPFPDTVVPLGITGSLGLALATDLDDDAHADLVIQRDGGLSVYFGDGHAGFSAPVVAATGAFTTLERSKTKVWARTASGVTAITPHPDRTFSEEQLAFAASTELAIGDIDGDGQEDIVSLPLGSPLFDVKLHSGEPTFTAGAAAALMNGFTVGDFNGDGLGDIAFSESQFSSSTIFVRLNVGRRQDGSFGFSQPILLSTGNDDSRHLRAIDFNDDGFDDLFGSHGNVFCQTFISQTPPGIGAGAMRVDNYWPGNANYTAAALSDVDRDGVEDLLLNNGAKIELWRIPGERGISSGRLVGPQIVESCACNAVRGGDGDGDGVGDLWIDDGGTGYLRLGLGDGTFGPRTAAAPGTMTTLPIAMGDTPFSDLNADIDGDGLVDRVHATNGNYQLEIYAGISEGAFAGAPAVTYPVYDIINNYLFLADLNKDGLIDAITSTRRNSKSQFNVLLGQQEALFAKRAFHATPVTTALPRRGQHGVSTVSGEADVNLHVARGMIGKPDPAFTRFTAPYQVYSRPRVELWLDLPIVASFNDVTAVSANSVVYEKVGETWQQLTDFSVKIAPKGRRFVRVRVPTLGIVQAFVAP